MEPLNHSRSTQMTKGLPRTCKKNSVLISSLYKLWPASNCTNEIAVMDIIKRLLVPRPVVLCVIEFEFAVWRHPAGLHTAEIGADDHSGRKHIREIDRPDARAGSEILHLLGTGVNGSPK